MRLWQESEVRYAILVAGFGLDEANHIVERLPRANRLLLIDQPASAGVDLSRRGPMDPGPGDFSFQGHQMTRRRVIWADLDERQRLALMTNLGGDTPAAAPLASRLTPHGAPHA